MEDRPDPLGCVVVVWSKNSCEVQTCFSVVSLVGSRRSTESVGRGVGRADGMKDRPGLRVLRGGFCRMARTVVGLPVAPDIEAIPDYRPVESAKKIEVYSPSLEDCVPRGNG